MESVHLNKHLLFCILCYIQPIIRNVSAFLYGEFSEASFTENRTTEQQRLQVIWSKPPTHTGPPTAQDYVETAFEYLQGWRLPNLSRQLVPLLKKFKKLTLV